MRRSKEDRKERDNDRDRDRKEMDGRDTDCQTERLKRRKIASKVGRVGER